MNRTIFILLFINGSIFFCLENAISQSTPPASKSRVDSSGLPILKDTSAVVSRIIEKDPFDEEILQYLSEDSLKVYKKPIVIIGDQLVKNFFNYEKISQNTVLNRGFGGAALRDVQKYFDYVIYPYKPRTIIIFCGRNDFEYSSKTTPKIVEKRFKDLFYNIRKKLRHSRVMYVSLVPNLKQQNLSSAFIKTNKLIKNFLRNQSNSRYVDFYSKIYIKHSKVKPSFYFQKDSVYFNEFGNYKLVRAIRENMK